MREYLTNISISARKKNENLAANLIDIYGSFIDPKILARRPGLGVGRTLVNAINSFSKPTLTKRDPLLAGAGEITVPIGSQNRIPSHAMESRGNKGASSAGNRNYSGNHANNSISSQQQPTLHASDASYIKRLVENNNGNFIGSVNKGATDNIRTVSQQQFQQLKVDLLKNAKPDGTYSHGSGTWYKFPDGSRIGVRTSGRHGETLDFNVNGLPSNFKIHQK